MTVVWDGRGSLTGDWPRQRQNNYTDHAILDERAARKRQSKRLGEPRPRSTTCVQGNVRLYCRFCARTQWGPPPAEGLRFQCTGCRQRSTGRPTTAASAVDAEA